MLSGCSFELTHVAPVGLGAAVEVTAWCVGVLDRLHCWHAELHAVEPRRLLAYGRLNFKLVDLGRFVARLERVTANQQAHKHDYGHNDHHTHAVQPSWKA